MNIAIDIGNTFTKTGFFIDQKLIEKFVFETGDIERLKEICEKREISKGIVSHSGKRFFTDTDLNLEEKIIWLDHNTPIPIENNYGTPSTLGKDRLAASIGAWTLFPKENSLIVDAGTCITFDLMLTNGVYEGGNISPGLKMRYKAMHEFTSALPLVEILEIVENDENVYPCGDARLGKSTTEALQLGGILGIVYEIEGYKRKLKKELNKINIILTGGDANYLVGFFKKKIFVCPDLILIGLNSILGYQNHLYE